MEKDFSEDGAHIDREKGTSSARVSAADGLLAERTRIFQLVCHDLANSLAALEGALELLREDPTLFAELEDVMNDACSSAQSLITEIRKMRDGSPGDK